VVHNAGILRDKTIAKLEPGDLDAVLDVHLKGGFNVVRPAWEHLCESGTGRIVVTASASGLIGNFGQSNYGAAKMGLVGMMNVLAVEGKKRGVKINTVAPGARTRMTEGLLGDLSEILDPDLVSPIVAYLASTECGVTGEIYGAAGGRFSRYFIGATIGWDAGRDAPASVEDVAEHLEQIRSEEGYFVPTSAADELKILNELRSQ
jgi:NAD(P)-dependent dehydrogenase (short-subunit alcohol dehydrogenase family)